MGPGTGARSLVGARGRARGAVGLETPRWRGGVGPAGGRGVQGGRVGAGRCPGRVWAPASMCLSGFACAWSTWGLGWGLAAWCSPVVFGQSLGGGLTGIRPAQLPVRGRRGTPGFGEGLGCCLAPSGSVGTAGQALRPGGRAASVASSGLSTSDAPPHLRLTTARRSRCCPPYG